MFYLSIKQVNCFMHVTVKRSTTRGLETSGAETVLSSPTASSAFDGNSPVDGRLRIQSMHDLKFVFVAQLSLELKISPQTRLGRISSAGLLNNAHFRFLEGLKDLAPQRTALGNFR